MNITEYDDVPSGTTGRVITRWAGTGYVVRLADGSFRWLGDVEVGSPISDRHRIQVGDMVEVTSDVHQHDFAHVGDKFQVVKISENTDNYQVAIGNKIHWFGEFQLARYIAPKSS